MDSLGSEVGQKMRSAVKAKLIELGTGGLAGYIDDELPDYVMIMIANKRSKQQMIGDLQLFLGPQTELFVTWLHEVLQKLQEVTLPAAVIHKTKRKSESNDGLVIGKKEKKEKKKEKDKKAKKSLSSSSSSAIIATTTEQYEKDSNPTSITDVFAGHLLQKAKKTMQDESLLSAKVKKNESNNKLTRDEFDIPTITEISESVEEIQKKKDLEELSKLQKKIYQAKAKLKLNEVDESEDEDYLNIGAEGEELDEVITTDKDKVDPKKTKRKPIVYDSTDEPNESKSNENSKEGVSHEHEQPRKRDPIKFSDGQRKEVENKEVFPKKKSIHERLGFNVKSLNTTETNLTVFRRLDRDIERETSEKYENQNRAFINLEKSLNRDKEVNIQKERVIDNISPVRRRIGSRVIVAPPKKSNFEEDDDYNITDEKGLSSMIKIKPRPSMSPSKQASKNLLLRAVAEAQKSTAFIQPSKKDSSILERSPKRLKNKRSSSKLHTKSFRNQKNENLKARIHKDNIVIEIKSKNRIINQNIDDIRSNDDDDGNDNDEYIPEPIYDRGGFDNDYVYIPQTINFNAVDDDDDMLERYHGDEERYSHNKTQFVVTLDDKTRKKFITTSHKNQLLKKSLNGLEKEKTTIDARKNIKLRNSSTLLSSCDTSCKSHSQYNRSSPRKIMKTSHSTVIENKNIIKKSERINILSKQPKEQIKKLIIKNDSDDDDIINTKENQQNENQEEKEKTKEKEKENEVDEGGSLTPPLPPSNIKRKRLPITFDLNDDKNTTKTKNEVSRDKNDQNMKVTSDNGNNIDDNVHQKISIKKMEATKKYENIPESLNSIAVEAPKKSKELCKYFPSCGKGDSCEFYHPTSPCKAFPNCKFVEKCLYLHPKCKFDLTCNRINCNYSHSVPVATTNIAPPLSSHVVPVQNYKTISANLLPAICKYYPNCTNSLCNFYHPKLCRFGKNCMNKVECNFYHFDLPVKDKFKWVASLG